MHTSTVHLNILNSSFKKILYLKKEIKINGQALKKRPSLQQIIGLAQGTKCLGEFVCVWDIIGALNIKY